MRQLRRQGGAARAWRTRSLGAFSALALLLVTGGCNDILEVELPDAVTDLALDDPLAAPIMVNSVIGQVECGYTSFTIEAAGYEDAFQATAAVGSGYADYSSAPPEGTCDGGDTTAPWFDPLMIARAFGQDAYSRIQAWSDAEVPNRQLLLGQLALYIGVSMDVFGEHFCDIVLDGGNIMNPDEALDAATSWIDLALGHFTGDPAGPNGSTVGGGMATFAHGIKARILWAQGDLANAAIEAAMVPDGYVANATREAGQARRNKAYFYHTLVGYGLLNGPIDWWTGTTPIPGTSTPWPSPIPFTGYIDLALAADGRAIDASQNPITIATAGSVADSRVLAIGGQVAQGGAVGYFPDKWQDISEDIPIVNWKEMRLIRAEADPANAVTHVNAVRAADPTLPLVTYGPAGAEIDDMIIEERRRALFLEGRFWATKIQNTDKLWFPRLDGQDQYNHDLEGGVRLVFPLGEYQLNPNLDPIDQASGCDGAWENDKPNLGLGSSV